MAQFWAIQQKNQVPLLKQANDKILKKNIFSAHTV
jgi:hypothetical protein